MSKTVAVLSDTHGLLRPEVMEIIAGCDLIIHSGDINRKEIIDRLEEIAPVYVVRGNNDKQWAEYLMEHLDVQVEDCLFHVVHNRKYVPQDLSGYDGVIFGHSHKYLCETKDGILWLNPGSCGKRRFDQEITFAMMEVNGKDIHVEKIRISHGEKK